MELVQKEKSFPLLNLAKNTYNYSVVSKRANRYRYQIYKDVLQHWYYSPFNRFLLKLDVDSFIRRQPNTHFLTQKEENLLHLRRFLLSEHYNTLRWYTNMEHYRSMKTQLNSSTKSFSSSVYNQQFAGTFKKIRHLFAITPIQESMSSSPTPFGGKKSPLPVTPDPNPEGAASSLPKGVTRKGSEQGGQRNGVRVSRSQALGVKATILKFDQPLYNEHLNTSENPLLKPLIIHEELFYQRQLLRFRSPYPKPLPVFTPSGLPDPNPEGAASSLPKGVTRKGSEEGGHRARFGAKVSTYQGDKNSSNDLLADSQKIVGNYLIQIQSERDLYIQKLLREKNYLELTKFIFKGKKMRGERPVTNQALLNYQEKEYLLDSLALFELELELDKKKEQTVLPFDPIQSDLYLTYLKKWKVHVNSLSGQESSINGPEGLKNYLKRKIKLQNERKIKKEKKFMDIFQKLQQFDNYQQRQRFESLLALTLARSPSPPTSPPFGRGRERGVRRAPLPVSLPSPPLKIRGGEEGGQGEEGGLGQERQKQLYSILKSGLKKSIFEGFSLLENVYNQTFSATVFDGPLPPSPPPLILRGGDGKGGKGLGKGALLTPEGGQASAYQREALFSLWERPKNFQSSLILLKNISTRRSKSFLSKQTSSLRLARQRRKFPFFSNNGNSFIYKSRAFAGFTPSGLEAASSYPEGVRERVALRAYQRDKKQEGVRNRQKSSRKEFRLLSKKSDYKDSESYFDSKNLSRVLSKNSRILSRILSNKSRKDRKERENSRILSEKSDILSEKSRDDMFSRYYKRLISKELIKLHPSGNFSLDGYDLEMLYQMYHSLRKSSDSGRYDRPTIVKDLEEMYPLRKKIDADPLANPLSSPPSPPSGERGGEEGGLRAARRRRAGTTWSSDSNNKGFLFNFLGIFSRKKSPQRRSRTRRARGVFRKVTLSNSLKQDFKSFFDLKQKFKSFFGLWSLSGARRAVRKTKASEKLPYVTPRLPKAEEGGGEEGLKPSEGELRGLRGQEEKGVSVNPEGVGEAKEKFYTKMNEKLYSISSPSASSSTPKGYSNPTKLNNGSNPFPPKGDWVTLSPPEGGQGLGRFPRGGELKQKQSKRKRQRSWSGKRIKVAQRRRKYRKRRRYSMSKLRNLSKKFKKIQNKNEMQNWWWKEYIPSIQNATEVLLQIEKDKIIEQKLSHLSIDELLKRYSMAKESKLQIGNKDFKPLALPESLKQIFLLRPPFSALTLDLSLHSSPLALSPPFPVPSLSPEGGLEGKKGDWGAKGLGVTGKGQGSAAPSSLAKQTPLSVTPEESDRSEGGLRVTPSGLEAAKAESLQQRPARDSQLHSNSFNMLNNLYMNLFTNQVRLKTEFKELLLPNASLPFYAGWDESLRKFVVTNRMLSRQDAGYAIPFGLLAKQPVTPSASKTRNPKPPFFTSILTPKGLGKGGNGQGKGSDRSEGGLRGLRGLRGQQSQLRLFSSMMKTESFQNSHRKRIDFTQAPLKGMNAPTTMYCQTPFTTYDPDQFFVKGLDGFAPLGWRQFLFRHSILKNWLNQINPPTLPIAGQRLEGTFEFFAKNVPFPNSQGAALRFTPSGYEDKEHFEHKKGLIVKSKTKFLDSLKGPQAALIPSGLESQRNVFGFTINLPNLSKSKKAFTFSRRLKKRLRKVKKYDKGQRLVPSGPLLTEVLPLHYIYVFNTLSRAPRDRYIKRRLLKFNPIQEEEEEVAFVGGSYAPLPPLLPLAPEGGLGLRVFDARGKKEVAGPALTLDLSPPSLLSLPFLSEAARYPEGVKGLGSGNPEGVKTGKGEKGASARQGVRPFFQANTDPNFLSYDFTLRKRFKPRRKYHLKRNSSKIVIPRRLKFMTLSTKNSLDFAFFPFIDSPKKGRPLSVLKINKSVAELVKEQKMLRSKQQRQDLAKKQPNLRIKQLRRRVLRQVLPSRSIWKFSPRAGGFVWPGDYLKLNLVKGANLERKQVIPIIPELPKGAGEMRLRFANPEGVKGKPTKNQRGKKLKKQLIFPGSDLELPIQPKKYLYEKHNLAARKFSRFKKIYKT
jgi:hypothetical protein